MSRAIGIGVIGMGWMGETHSHSYRAIKELGVEAGFEPRLIVCADDVESRARRAQQRFGFERTTGDWREVIADPAVEVVTIAAPNYLHLEIAQAAAAAGKHIFCEKPVGRGPEETAAIAAAARQAGVITGVGFNYRWAPLVQYARQLIAEGRLGTLTHYRGRFFSMYGSNPSSVLSWRFQRELAGLGTLGDLMSHVVDMAHMLAGPVDRLVANQETFIKRRPEATPGAGTHFTVGEGGPQGEVTNEDYAGALVRFASGAQGTFEACRAIVGPKCQMAFEVHGTCGALSWDFERMNELALYLPDGTGAHEGYTRIVTAPEHPFHGLFNPAPGTGLGYGDLKVVEAYQFLKSVATGAQGQPGFREALAVAQVQAAFERSWKSGGWEEAHTPRAV